MRNLELIRMYVRRYLRESMDSADQSLEKHRDKDDEPDNTEDLLTEPDASVEDPQREVSAIGVGGGALTSTGAIRGVTTPLGTTSTYPAKSKRKKKRKSVTDVVARAFGGAKPVKD